VQDGMKGTIDYNNKVQCTYINYKTSRLCNKEDFEWAIEEATKKKKQDFSRVEFLTYDEVFVFNACTWVLMIMSQQQLI
jgi:hypothetical protein